MTVHDQIPKGYTQGRCELGCQYANTIVCAVCVTSGLPVIRPEWVISVAEVCNFPKRNPQPARRDSSFPITVSQTKLPRLGTMVGTRSVGLLEADISATLKPDTRSLVFQRPLLPNSSRAGGISCSGRLQLCRILRLRHLAPVVHLFVALARFLDPHGTVRGRIYL